MQHLARFGTWKSSLTAEQAASSGSKTRDCVWDDNRLTWVETRPAERGRCALMGWSPEASAPNEILPRPWNVRTRVHEYGGRAHCFHNGVLYFVDDADNQVYCCNDKAGESPSP